MKIDITKELVLQRYPVEYAKAIQSLKKKKCSDDAIENAEWTYEYGVKIDNDVPPDTKAEYIEFRKNKIGVSLNVQVGRKRDYFDISKYNFPNEFIDMFTQQWDNIQIEKQLDEQRTTNLDSILKAVGKEGTCNPEIKQDPFNAGNGVQLMQHIFQAEFFQQPVYPTLEDLKNGKPEIYQQYLEKCDGKQLVLFSPHHKECDEWGFVIEKLLAVTKRLNKPTNEAIYNRFICDELNGSSFYYIKDELISWQGSLHSADKHIVAIEGEEFRAWKKTRQYRLRQHEYINDINKPLESIQPLIQL